MLKLTRVEPLSPVSLLNIYMLSQNLFGKECKRHFDKIRDDERKNAHAQRRGVAYGLCRRIDLDKPHRAEGIAQRKPHDERHYPDPLLFAEKPLAEPIAKRREHKAEDISAARPHELPDTAGKAGEHRQSDSSERYVHRNGNAAAPAAEKQQSLLDEKIAAFEAQGDSPAQARENAEDWVALPGTSEHQTGLAVDINADGIHSAGREVYRWLDQNAYRYGFILRYPSDKTGITGISNEPWHYRYVGVTAAAEIRRQNLCLEEYLNQRTQQ